MNENGNHIDYHLLASKYLAGEASKPEIEALESWVRSSDNNKKLYSDFKRAWTLSHTSVLNYNSVEAWEKIEKDLFEEDTIISIKQKSTRRSFMLKIAAAISILFALSFIVYYFIQQSGTTEISTFSESVTETLNDGSSITLNHNSTITYSKNYNKKDRIIKLSGNAFFDVERIEDKPFIVQTEETAIRVLGTSFYIESQKNENEIIVTVNSGNVLFSDNSGNSLELTRGETGIFDKRKKTLQKSINRDLNYLSWKTRKLVFEDSPLYLVFKSIEKTYHVDIDISDQSLNECRITSTFDQLDLETVFQIILDIYPSLRINASENGYTVSGPGCNS